MRPSGRAGEGGPRIPGDTAVIIVAEGGRQRGEAGRGPGPVAKMVSRKFRAFPAKPGPTPRPGGTLRRWHFLLFPIQKRHVDTLRIRRKVGVPEYAAAEFPPTAGVRSPNSTSQDEVGQVMVVPDGRRTDRRSRIGPPSRRKEPDGLLETGDQEGHLVGGEPPGLARDRLGGPDPQIVGDEGEGSDRQRDEIRERRDG